MPARSSYKTYTVVSGDTLSKIAARFGSTVPAIASASGITDPNRIAVGQALLIPVPVATTDDLSEVQPSAQLRNIVSSPKTPPKAAGGQMVTMSLLDYVRPWFEPPRLYGTLAIIAAGAYYLLSGNKRRR